MFCTYSKYVTELNASICETKFRLYSTPQHRPVHALIRKTMWHICMRNTNFRLLPAGNVKHRSMILYIYKTKSYLHIRKTNHKEKIRPEDVRQELALRSDVVYVVQYEIPIDYGPVQSVVSLHVQSIYAVVKTLIWPEARRPNALVSICLLLCPG